jgi:hypothetical protein
METNGRVLEFYPDHRAPFLSLITRLTDVSSARSPRAVLLLAVLLLAGGCAQMATSPRTGASPDDAGGAARPTAPPIPANVEPPAPKVNLSGFPLPYRQGYADGCASVGATERKDAARYAADGNYRTGWDDGRAICARR